MRTIRFYTWNGIRQTRNGYAHVKRTAVVLVNKRQAVPPVYFNNLHSRTRKLNSNKTSHLPDRGSRELVGLINSMKISFGYSITREYRIFIHSSNIARNIRRRKPFFLAEKFDKLYAGHRIYHISRPKIYPTNLCNFLLAIETWFNVSYFKITRCI